MAEIILGLMGGLGLFLYGMRLMSDSLEKAAGAKMRSILEFFTKTPLRGILVGTFFTAIIQSSSAATVMAVSFVNSGLMNLYQAAGVIMGANIGTTITSQLIAFNLSELAPVIIMAGIFMLMFSRKTRVQRAGKVLVGFALETNDEQHNAEDKLNRKNLDFIVLNSLNDKGAGFRYDTNKISIIDRNGKKDYPLKSKAEVAADIVDHLVEVMKRE